MSMGFRIIGIVSAMGSLFYSIFDPVGYSVFERAVGFIAGLFVLGICIKP